MTHEGCFVDDVLWTLLDHPPRSSDRGAFALLLVVYLIAAIVIFVR